jgi:hypothetical protein
LYVQLFLKKKGCGYKSERGFDRRPWYVKYPIRGFCPAVMLMMGTAKTQAGIDYK